MKIAIIAIQLLLIYASFFAQPAPTPDKSVYIPGGFGKGQDYLKMSEKEKRAYAMGAMNGMLVAPFFDAPEKSTNWLSDYLKGVSSEQVAAIITKYLKDSPELWHLGLNALTYKAIWEAYHKTYDPDSR
jgi:hypothetical protein